MPRVTLRVEGIDRASLAALRAEVQAAGGGFSVAPPAERGGGLETKEWPQAGETFQIALEWIRDDTLSRLVDVLLWSNAAKQARRIWVKLRPLPKTKQDALDVLREAQEGGGEGRQ